MFIKNRCFYEYPDGTTVYLVIADNGILGRRVEACFKTFKGASNFIAKLANNSHMTVVRAKADHNGDFVTDM